MIVAQDCRDTAMLVCPPGSCVVAHIQEERLRGVERIEGHMMNEEQIIKCWKKADAPLHLSDPANLHQMEPSHRERIRS